MATSQWQVLDEATGTWSIEYSFRPDATARALVTRTRDGGLLIISPPLGLSTAAREKLKSHGNVTRVIAPNGLHWMGVPGLIEDFPEARVYAPSAALARVQKRLPDIHVRNLDPLAQELTDGVSVEEVPGFRFGDTWLKVPTEEGGIWYVSDCCLNMPKLPSAWLPRLLFKWTASGPGFALNGVGLRFMLKDKASYRQWFLEQLGEEPRAIVPAHGDVLEQPGIAKDLKQMVEARL